MKLLLVSSLLLLVSLASAEPTPYVTVLYEDGYHLAEGNLPNSHYDSVREISLYHKGNLLETNFNSKTTRGYDTLDLKRDLLNGTGFAIEAYPPGPEFPGGSGFCTSNSSEQLKPLIENCYKAIKLRLLTAEEREKLRQYKEEQKVSGKPFEVIFENGRVTTKSAQVDHFFFGDYLTDFYYHHVHFLTEINMSEDWNDLDFNHRLGGNSYVIEPTESNEKCGAKGLEGLDLKFNWCRGNVLVRRN